MEIHTVQEENQSMAVSERVSGYSEMMNDSYIITYIVFLIPFGIQTRLENTNLDISSSMIFLFFSSVKHAHFVRGFPGVVFGFPLSDHPQYGQ